MRRRRKSRRRRNCNSSSSRNEGRKETYINSFVLRGGSRARTTLFWWPPLDMHVLPEAQELAVESWIWLGRAVLEELDNSLISE